MNNQAEAYLKNHENTNMEDFRTPPYLFKWIDQEYGPIEYDGACTDGLNNLAPSLRLEDEWPKGTTVYSNPPYDMISLKSWFEKGLSHVENGGVHIMLVPNKICQVGFVESINDYIQEIVFLGGRIDFISPYSVKGGTSRNGCFLLVNSKERLLKLRSIKLKDIKKEMFP